MNHFNKLKVFSITAALAVNLTFTQGLNAQEVDSEHLQAARAAVSALGATNSFDAILPNAAEQLKQSLIQSNPNLQEQISAVVDDNAIKIAGRRADLETEAANIYAKNFTKEQLEALAAFYESDAGIQFLKLGPIATRDLIQAARIWGQGIARDLNSETQKTLNETVGQQ